MPPKGVRRGSVDQEPAALSDDSGDEGGASGGARGASLEQIQSLLSATLAQALAPVQEQLKEQAAAAGEIAEELAVLKGEKAAAAVAEIVIQETSPSPSPAPLRQTTTYPAAPTQDREERAGFLRKAGLSANDITDIFDREDYLGGKQTTRKIGDLTQTEEDTVLAGRLHKIEQEVQRWQYRDEGIFQDPVPYLETGLARPDVVFKAQRAGLRVELDLFTEIEFASVIPGYTDFPVGAKAELEIAYVSQGRLDDVLSHLIQADRGTSQLNLQRVIEVLSEIRELKNERLEGILERAYVRTTNIPGENDQTVIAKMDRKRQDRLRPQRSTSWRKEELTMRTLVDTQKAKLLASHRAREELKRSGVPVGAAGATTKVKDPKGKGGGAPPSGT